MDEKILILGIGNDILKDDGIGPRLVKDLQKSSFPEGISFKTSSMGGLEILELIRDYHTVMILDAIKTKDGNPGDVYYFNPSDFHETMHLSNLHDVNFITALELAKKIKLSIPETIHIIAVEILEDMEFGRSLSPELEEKYPEILSRVQEHLQSKLFPD
ncbi:MAG: hydrogenase maturation protease [Bacteroidetes bacterium]|nr:hydrogenase maturation protease [Bacteroidota bacterium]